jgi:hypothetical protein
MESLNQPQWRDLPHEWRLLAQSVKWMNTSRLETRWCVPVAPASGTVPTDDFAVCTSQQAAYGGARRLLAGGLARQARTADEHALSALILRVMPAWEDLADDIVMALPLKAAAAARNPA